MSEQLDPGWVRSGWGHSVRSQDEAFRAISRIVSLAANRRYVWRGSTNSKYRLRSSLLRHLIVAEDEPLPNETYVRQHELAILREARSGGWPPRWALSPLTCTCSPTCSTTACPLACWTSPTTR